MMIRIDPHSGIPVYRQIFDQVRFQISAGILAPGEPLESVRSLAATLGINSMTVSKAYSLLERDGDVERRPGQHLTVATRPRRQQESAHDTHVREALAPAVTVVQQLGMPKSEAVQIFRELLDEETQPKEKPHAARR